MMEKEENFYLFFHKEKKRREMIGLSVHKPWLLPEVQVKKSDVVRKALEDEHVSMLIDTHT